MSKYVVGAVCLGAGFFGGLAYSEFRNGEAAVANPSTPESTASTLPLDINTATTNPETTTSLVPETITLPLSGIICRGPEALIQVNFVPEWNTYSLFNAVKLQYDPSEKITDPSVVPQAVAESFARDVANLNFNETANTPIYPGSVIVDINDWRPNGAAPTEAVVLPTTCDYKGVTVLR
jgi:hypothetical protein